MSSHTSEAKVDLAAVQAPGFESTRKFALIAGVAGLVGAIVMALIQEGGMRHLQFSWLWACFYFVTLGLGALFFVLLQHLTRAGWSVVVRRLADVRAGVFLLCLMVLGCSAPVLDWCVRCPSGMASS